MTQFSKEEAARFLAFVEKGFEQIDPDKSASLVGPVEVAGFCRDLISLIENARELAEISDQGLPPKIKYLLRGLCVAQECLDLAHLYVPFTEVIMFEKREMEELLLKNRDLMNNTEKKITRACSEITHTYSEMAGRLDERLHDLIERGTIR